MLFRQRFVSYKLLELGLVEVYILLNKCMSRGAVNWLLMYVDVTSLDVDICMQELR